MTVNFGAGAYSVEESDDTSTPSEKENEVTVTVTLSAAPEREVIIPIRRTNRGASDSDYSGVAHQPHIRCHGDGADLHLHCCR